MFNGMLDESKELKYRNRCYRNRCYRNRCYRNNRFQESYNVKHLRNRTFKESSKSRGVFRAQASIYDGAFLWIYLAALFLQLKLHHRCLTGLYIGLRK